MKMSDLKSGDKAVVTSVEPGGEITQRLFDMGIVKGTTFKVLRKAPLGDPIEIMLRGFMLALRVNEAEKILVERTGQVGDGMPMGPGMGRGRGRGGRGKGRGFGWGKRK